MASNESRTPGQGLAALRANEADRRARSRELLAEHRRGPAPARPTKPAATTRPTPMTPEQRRAALFADVARQDIEAAAAVQRASDAIARTRMRHAETALAAARAEQLAQISARVDYATPRGRAARLAHLEDTFRMAMPGDKIVTRDPDTGHRVALRAPITGAWATRVAPTRHG